MYRSKRRYVFGLLFWREPQIPEREEMRVVRTTFATIIKRRRLCRHRKSIMRIGCGSLTGTGEDAPYCRDEAIDYDWLVKVKRRS